MHCDGIQNWAQQNTKNTKNTKIKQERLIVYCDGI